jgi:hypothetical protein
VSTNPPVEAPQNDPSAARRVSRQIDQAFEEVARLSGSNLPPSNFYEEFLAKVMAGVNAPAGAVWLRTPQGFLQLQCQTNVEQVGLDAQRGGRQAHNELLRQAFQTGRPMLLEPYSNTGIAEGAPAGNPTGYVCLLAPVMLDEKNAIGLVEIWQEPRWDARAQRTFLNYLVQMAGYAGNYVKNQESKKGSGEGQVWQQLEVFARNVHSSLNPTEVAYLVANDGRRLVGCDRLSVAVRHERKAVLEAVSGADVIEKRSALMKQMRKLIDTVIAWGERLTYRGTKDDTLPPKVLAALDAFLAESNSKLLVVEPLLDDRDKVKEGERGKPKKARSALVFESFETPEDVEPMIARFDVVCRHAAPALYNAAEMKRVPFRWVWWPLMKIQDGLGGKTKIIIGGIVLAVLALIGTLVIVPYPLKLEANGQLLPKERQYVYSSRDAAKVVSFYVEPGSEVPEDGRLVKLYDPTLQQKLDELSKLIASSETKIRTLSVQANDPSTNAAERFKLEGEKAKEDVTKDALNREYNTFLSLLKADGVNRGFFDVATPSFSRLEKREVEPRWTVLTSDFRETLTNRTVKPSDPLLRLGNKAGEWEIELKIPQKHIGQVKAALGNQEELDVDLLVQTIPTRTYRGKLSRLKIAGEAVPNRDDHNESEPIVLAYVRISGEGIAPEDAVPRDQLVTGVEVHAKVRCGSHPSGYSLFYGVWEFIYAKVIFFLF